MSRITPPPGDKVPAAHNALRILSLLAARHVPVSAASVATALDLPRSSVYHLLSVLVENGFAVHLLEERKYGLGIAAFELSSSYARQAPLSRLGAPILAALVDTIGESAHLAVLNGSDVVYVVEERAKFRPALVTEVGVRLPAHLTASGRAIMSAMPLAQVRAMYPAGSTFASRNDREPTVTSYADLKVVLNAARQRGYAFEDGEVTPELTTLAVPVKDHLGWPVAAVAVTFTSTGWPDSDRPELVAEINSAADELSRRIYGQPR
ncbi:IclR family transcriptional regulator [Brevibacterium limosum]|uniref:IclR family transcriptional regulator n=1 Tax=Brevibacterium limosum TaxID=2697565 RepID=UPI00141DC8DE|nr:IclR family transcriptional regulator [Brevibacterium limosum]